MLVADVALAGQARQAAGLTDRSADFVLMNPPFNDRRDRATPDALRREAHVAEADQFEAWLRSAAAMLKPRGRVALIARPASIAPVLTALAGRFGSTEIVPIHATPERPAIRIVVRAVRGARGAPVVVAATHPAARPERALNGARRGDQFGAVIAFRRLTAAGIAWRAPIPTCGCEHEALWSQVPVRSFFRRLLPKSMRPDGVTIPVVRMTGTIMAGGGQFRPDSLARHDSRSA